MQSLLEKLDDLGGIETKNNLAKWLDRAAFVFMILMFLSAPNSIAATQISWLTGMFLWFVRLFIKPRPSLVRTPLDVPLWIFFAWSIVSAIFSYDPLTSFDKLRGVALFLIFYFVVNVVKTKRAAIFLASALIFSTMASVVWTPIERIFGRGVEVLGVSAESPLTKARLGSGDTLLKANDKKVWNPDELLAEIQANESTKIDFYRPDFYFTVEVKRADLLDGATALEKLGVADWKRGRNWRSAGFYGHYATYAEVLQLVASLAFGLFIAAFGGNFLSRKNKDETNKTPQQNKFAANRSKIILAVCLIGMAFALLLTVTRASQLGFLVSSLAIVIIAGNRRMLLILAVILLPITLGGLFFLQQSRQVGFFDSQDDSTKYRQTVYREGFHLWTENARHLMLGVGMDSIKKYAKEWHLFDDGRLPMGHFHSTPLQLLVERGLPALLLWLWILWIYFRTLLRNLRLQNSEDETDWKMRGIILGSFGGAVGFFTGGLVHYNLGDAEVAMIFFMLMGLAITNYEFQMRNKTLATNNTNKHE